MMSALLKTLREERGKLAKEYEDTRAPFDGKRGDTPGDIEERLEQIFNDLQRVDRDIKIELSNIDDVQTDRAISSEFVGSRTGAEKTRAKEQLDLIRGYLGSTNPVTSQQYLARAHSVDITTEGGAIALPAMLMDLLLQKKRKGLLLRSLANKLGNVPRAGGAITTNFDDATCARGGEITTPSETSVTFGKKQYKPIDYTALVKISRPLLRESNVEDIVFSKLNQAWGEMEEQEFFTGTGSNQGVGLLTVSTAGIDSSRDFDTAGSGVISADDILDLQLKNIRPPYAVSGRYILSQAALAAARKLKDTAGNYIWIPTGNLGGALGEGVPGLLAGKPYDVSEYMPTISTGNYPIIFGDFDYYHLVDGLEQTIEVVDQLYAATNQNGYFLRGGSDFGPALAEAFARLKVKA